MNLVFDLHCDTPYFIEKGKFNHIIPNKLHEQKYIGAVFAHFVAPRIQYPFVDAVRMISSTLAYIHEQSSLIIARQYQEIKKDNTNIILGVEGGHIFDNTFKQIEALYNLGVRVFTITWNNSNKLAHSALKADKKGLTKRGRSFLKHMKDFNIIIDLSHASTRTALDICEYSANRIIASHSCVRTLNPSFLRNIDDLVIKAIKDKGGVVGVNFSRHHLGKYSVTEHIDHIVQNFGVEVAAIGSDFDGINDAVIKRPTGIDRIEEGLLGKGYRQKDIEKIFHGNFLRVFKKA
jgi:membrane dipeptidase